MKKRMISILLMVCLCMVALTGCKSDAPAPAAAGTTNGSQTVQESGQKILGVVADADMLNTDEETLYSSCGVNYSDYSWREWYTSDIETVADDATQLVDVVGCETIIFAVTGSAQIAEQFSLEHPEIRVLITDIAKTVEPTIEAQYEISNVITDFSENRAWVSFHDGISTRFGLIDENGYLLYSFDNGHGETATTVTKFSEGVSCLRHGSTMLLINADGVVFFDTTEETENGHVYTYMGQGGGIILAQEHVSNFYENADYVCMIDSDGNVVNRLEMPESFDGWLGGGGGVLTYLGENLFYRTGDNIIGQYNFEIYNCTTNNIIDTGFGSKDTQSLTKFEDGFAFYCFNGSVYKLSTDAFESQSAWNSFDFSSALVGTFDKNCIAIGESYIIDSKGIYDYDGRLITSFPETWNVFLAEPFSGGYAALGLIGASNLKYFTVIDKSGAMQFEPIQYDYVHNAFRSSWHGYVSVKINDVIACFDPSGRQITEAEYKILEASGENTSVDSVWVRISSDSTSFTNQDGNILDTVYVVSNYDELIQQNNDQAQNDSESNTSATSKDYISASNFSITGKWKNIGTYAFGQVQSGAIVAFDGTNCNFYSPQDTYAFYRDGDNYKLECTSLLAETLSFTVKIVDENNIDVFNGSNILELTRVE